MSALARLVGAAVTGVATGGLVGTLADAPLGVLAGIAATETVFVVTGWAVLWPMDAARTRRNAQREDFRPVLEEPLVVGTALCGLVAIVVLLLRGNADSRVAAAAIALAGVFMAWAALHLMYAGRYADLYYRAERSATDSNRHQAERGGIDSTPHRAERGGTASIPHRPTDNGPDSGPDSDPDRSAHHGPDSGLDRAAHDGPDSGPDRATHDGPDRSAHHGPDSGLDRAADESTSSHPNRATDP
ncbi:DUF1345 domain-containing protein, partial [Nonomuraea antri]|uniref:DUF1345 domain-containing protein n=1 Tax=Nonomuraea antri TaxID=2730852 RepID=UPI001C2BCF8F